MKQYNIHETKTHLSALVEEAYNGHPFVIAKSGRPMVRVVPYDEIQEAPKLGFMKGRISVPDDFDTMGRDEILEMFGERP